VDEHAGLDDVAHTVGVDLKIAAKDFEAPLQHPNGTLDVNAVVALEEVEAVFVWGEVVAIVGSEHGETGHRPRQPR